MLPNSLRKTFGRIKGDLDPQAEAKLIENHRRAKATAAAALQFLLVATLVTLMTQQMTKRFVFVPTIDNTLGQDESIEALLNSEMREEAFKEIEAYEEELNFDILTGVAPSLSEERIEKLVKGKATEVFEEFRAEGESALGNVYADLSAVVALFLVVLFSRRQFIAFKEFISSIVSGFSDAGKAFILILLSDIVVGFHSPHGWEVLIESVSKHLGIVASHNVISVFIATVPVVMDTFFKYWLFSSLTKMSPSTVATLKEMND